MKKTERYPIHPIRTDADYRAALALVAPYFDHEPEQQTHAVPTRRAPDSNRLSPPIRELVRPR